MEGDDHCPWEMEALRPWMGEDREGKRSEFMILTGVDGSGDLCRIDNIEDLVSKVKSANQGCVLEGCYRW